MSLTISMRGTGESDLTWQGMVGMAYAFDSLDVIAARRYLDYDVGRDAPITSIIVNGRVTVLERRQT